MGGDGPTNPTNPDWPDPNLPTVATVAEKLPWPLNEIFGGRTLTSQELRDLRRFLDPYTLRRLRTDADHARDDADRTREWADKERDYARQWRELAEDSEREARKWREKAKAEADPESRARYEKLAESYEKDAKDRRERAGSYDGEAEKHDKRAGDYEKRHDQAVKDAEKAVRDAEQKVQAEKEAERLARERAEREKINKQREKQEKERRERAAKWEKERAESQRKQAAERRAKQEAEAREKEFKRLDGNHARAHEQFKEAEEALRRDPNNRRYRELYELWRQRSDGAGEKLAAFMEGEDQGGSSKPRTRGPVGIKKTPSAAPEAMRSQARDKALEVGFETAEAVLTEGSETAGRTAAGALLGKAMDMKAIYDLGENAQEVVDKSREEIRKEEAAIDAAIDDPNADPMEPGRVRWGHLKERLFIMQK